MNNTMTTEELDKLEALALDESKEWLLAIAMDRATVIALIAQARASMPVQAEAPSDERAAFDEWLFGDAPKSTYVGTAWDAWQARAALAAKAQQAEAEPVAADLTTHEGRCKAIRDIGGPAMAYAVQHGKISINDAARCCAAAPVSAAPAAPTALDADEMTRLRRLIHALGMDGSANASEDKVRGLLFTALGQAAGKIERAAMSAAPAVEKEQQR